MPKSRTLAAFFGVDKVDFNLFDHEKILRSTAHIVIDAQRYYADPEYRHNPEHVDDSSYPQGGGDEKTDAVSDNLASLVPKFKDAGIKTGWVYFRNRPHENEDAYGGFHKVQPDTETDFFYGKSKTSPFEDEEGQDGPFKEFLDEKGIKNLIVSGFNTSACLYNTVLDALDEGLNVCVLMDMTENGAGGDPKLNEKIHHMRAKGAIITDSESVLSTLHNFD